MSTPLTVSLAFAPDDIRPVGRLAMRDHMVFFEWTQEALKSPLGLSPFTLPEESGVSRGPRDPFGGLPGLFGDSLPDAWGRLLTDRAMRRAGMDPASLTPLDRLAAVGRAGQGALIYQPETAPAEVVGPVDADALAAAASMVVQEEGALDAEAFDRLRGVAGSSGGARPKALLHRDTATGQFHADAKTGREPWIVKFHTPSDGPDTGAVEAACAVLARRCGLNMTEAALVPSKNNAGWFATKRFDRLDGEWRLHMLSLAGLLEADWRMPSVGYDALVKAARILTRHEAEAEAAFRLMVFNIAIHNRDDHTKNAAFLMDDVGKWRLAPAFDLTISDGPGGEHTMDVAGEGKTPARADALRLAAHTGIRPKIATRILEEVGDGLTNARAILREQGVRSPAATRATETIENGRARLLSR